MPFTEYYSDIKTVVDAIWEKPELGYKEFHTKETVEAYLTRLNPNIELHYFSTTGMKVNLSTGKAKTVAFIAELDAVYAPTHFHADKETGAAHNCGHYTQVGIALALYTHLFKTKAYEALDYNLQFVFVPAEEYLDLAYRKSLKEQGVIQYYGGKPEAMRLGVFDDVDFGICVHAIGEQFTEPTIELYCDLAGFLYKHYTFEGKASHAGFDPFSGANAYSMSTLFNVALGLTRQHVRDDQSVRFNPIVAESDMSTNVIPNRVKIGTDLRCKTVAYMKETVQKLDMAAKGSAMALNGRVTIDTEMGYLPFVQDRYLSDLARSAFEKQEVITGLIADRGSIAAAGDIGDLSFMFPCMQISYGGFVGSIHGDDFKMEDPHFVLETFPAYLMQVLAEMNGKLEDAPAYKRTYADYEALLASIVEE